MTRAPRTASGVYLALDRLFLLPDTKDLGTI